MREMRKAFFWRWLISFCIGFSGVACMYTGFAPELESVSLMNLGLFCALFSLISAACVSSVKAGKNLLIVTAVGFALLWLEGSMGSSLGSLLYRISVIYDKGYHWGTAQWVPQASRTASPELGLCIVAGLAILVICRGLSRRKSILLPVFAGFLPLFSCLVVTHRVPASWCLVMLLAAQFLMILTNAVRRRSIQEANRLTALLLVPVMLCSMGLFFLVPRDSEIQGSNIWDWLQQFSFAQQIVGGGNGRSQLDLRGVGPKEQGTNRVMTVSASQPGNLYLRGQSLDVYDGSLWKASEVSTEASAATGWPTSTQGLQELDVIKIRTVVPYDMLYFPYSPAGDLWTGSLREGMLENADQLRSYSFSRVRRMTSGSDGLLYSSSSSSSFLWATVSLAEETRQQCLQLPEETRKWAEAIVDQLHFGDNSVYTKVQAIGQYVQSSAAYDLHTPAMPAEEQDFALWFLESSDTGYCIHFATAATVLLRAAGVPARYVSGYVASIPESGTATVTSDRSHAWVEYFDYYYGWLLLDPTPITFEAESGEVVEPSRETTAPATEPDETTAPVQTTAPTQNTTQQTAATVPTAGAEPGQKMNRRVLLTVLLILATLCGLCALAIGQYVLRRRSRRQAMNKGSMNRQVLECWQEVAKMSSILKMRVPEELEHLAEKAKFSQHKLTAEEKKVFQSYLKECSGKLKTQPFGKRLWIRLVWAIE